MHSGINVERPFQTAIEAIVKMFLYQLDRKLRASLRISPQFFCEFSRACDFSTLCVTIPTPTRFFPRSRGGIAAR
jgi:hypothetical protein